MCNISVSSKRELWNMFGYSIPKQEVVYFSSVLMIYIIIFICLINLCIREKGKDIWVKLLLASIGYLTPKPTLK